MGGREGTQERSQREYKNASPALSEELPAMPGSGMQPCPFSRKGPILLLCYPKLPKHEDELVGEVGLWLPQSGQVKWSHWPFQGTPTLNSWRSPPNPRSSENPFSLPGMVSWQLSGLLSGFEEKTPKKLQMFLGTVPFWGPIHLSLLRKLPNLLRIW